MCAYTCTIEKAFYKHLKLHSLGLSVSSVKISCVICGKDRPTEVDMNKHMRRHRDNRYFCCDICIFRTVQLKKVNTVDNNCNYYHCCRSQWTRGLKRRSTAARLLRSWVQIAPETWISVCCECCVLSGRGLCDELITRPEESYQLWCVVVYDLEKQSL